MTEPCFSSLQVSEASGLTLRQLQWWDEEGVLSPRKLPGHSHGGLYRSYTRNQVILAMIMAALRSKAMPLQAIRSVRRKIKKMVPELCGSSVLVVPMRSTSVAHARNWEAGMYVAHSATVPVFVVAAGPILAKLSSFRPARGGISK